MDSIFYMHCAGTIYITNVKWNPLCRIPEGEPIPDQPVPLVIGANNVFEVGCTIFAQGIGDHNVLEVKCEYTFLNC